PLQERPRQRYPRHKVYERVTASAQQHTNLDHQSCHLPPGIVVFIQLLDLLSKLPNHALLSSSPTSSPLSSGVSVDSVPSKSRGKREIGGFPGRPAEGGVSSTTPPPETSSLSGIAQTLRERLRITPI